MIVPGKRYGLRTRAASITPAMPLALSLAPGESLVASSASETRESMSPVMMTRRSGSVVPGSTARTFTTQVSTGIRDPGSPFTRVLWNETSRQPPHRSEIRSSSALIQRLAPPMPRVSLSVSDSV